MTTTTTTNPLTPRQLDVLQWLSAYIDTHGYSPSVREIAHSYGWSTNGVLSHLRALRRKGRVTWIENQARTIRVVGGDA